MAKCKSKVIFILLLVIMLAQNAGTWMMENFGTVTFSQIIFTIKTSETGTESSMMFDTILHCFVIPIVATIVIFLYSKFIYHYIIKQYIVKIVNKKKNREVRIYIKHGTWILIVLMLLHAVKTTYVSFEGIGLIEYFTNIQKISTVYEDYYVDPQNVVFEAPEEKQNLIYIVLESIEVAFASQDVGGVMDTNVIPELTKIHQENKKFTTSDAMSGFKSVAGTGWTAASLTAQYLGVPLMIPIDGNAYGAVTFLPGAYGIGEILTDLGYKTQSVLGSDSDFGGRTLLYKQHGIENVIDYNVASQTGRIPEDYRVWWGFEDAKLFDICKEEILRLSEEEEPFFFTTLTVDTHAQDGYMCEDCMSTFQDQYSNVITCSDARVAEFVSWIQAQDFYENTTIIIAGDHATMNADYMADVATDYQRNIYYTIINSAVSAPEVDREYTTLDLMPTALASLGIAWDGDRLALGTNLFGTEPTLSEELGYGELNNQINMYSEYYYDKLLYDGDK